MNVCDFVCVRMVCMIFCLFVWYAHHTKTAEPPDHSPSEKKEEKKPRKNQKNENWPSTWTCWCQRKKKTNECAKRE